MSTEPSILRQRVLTALTLIPLFVAGILALPTTYLALVFVLVVLVAASEWARLSGLGSCWWQIAYLLASALAGSSCRLTTPG